MVQFADSPHQASMRQYEQRCRQANASDQSSRTEYRKSIEDRLVEGGLASVEGYEKLLDERWSRAKCLAEYDGIAMGYGIAKRARARISEMPTSEAPI